MNRGKLLFISQRLKDKVSGARVVSTTNLGVARNIFGFDNVTVYGIEKKRNGRISSIVRKSKGLLDGLCEKDLTAIDNLVSNGLFAFVYLDSSLFGFIAKQIKSRYPSIKVITFYHDILVHWWRETGIRTPLSWNFNLSVYKRSESLCAKYSDRNIVMSARDKELLHEYYSVEYDRIDIIPLSIDETSRHIPLKKVNTIPYLLFIGVDYRPNIEGLEWFLENVQPSIKIKLKIVGKGLEKYRAKWANDNVEVVGRVVSLEEWYKSSVAVIIPLLSGSGMKVKTAEALSYGKPVFSTDEGLIGYHVEGVRGIFRCNSPRDFIDAINTWLDKSNIESYVPEIRALFEEGYSMRAAGDSFSKVIDRCLMSQ